MLFSYGGELGDYATYEVDGIINSRQGGRRARCLQGALQVHASRLGQRQLRRGQPGDHREPGRDEHELFRVLPSLINEASNPNAKNTGFFANPAGPKGDQFAPLGGQGISIVSYSQKQAEALKFLEWFIKDETQKKWAELGGYTCSAAVLKSDEFQNATPYNKAFYETMFKVKDFWAVPENGELLESAERTASVPVCRGRPGHRHRRRSTASPRIGRRRSRNTAAAR